MNRKKELLEAFFLIILFLFIIAQLVLPETGIGGVLNEGSMAILFFGIGIFCICSIVKKKKKEKSALILGIGLSIFAFIFGYRISERLIKDLMEGPHMIHLTSVTERETNGLSGLISHHYYLCGRDETGKKYEFEISSDEFYGLENTHEITVLCYLRTERIFKFVDDK